MCVNVKNRTFGPVHSPKKANISLQFAFQEFDDFPHEFLPVAITTLDGKLLANDARYYFAIRRYVMVDIALPVPKGFYTPVRGSHGLSEIMSQVMQNRRLHDYISTLPFWRLVARTAHGTKTAILSHFFCSQPVKEYLRNNRFVPPRDCHEIKLIR